MLTALKGFIEPTNNDLSIFTDIGGYTTTGGTLPVDVIVSRLEPTMVFYNKKKNTVNLVELTVPFENNTQKLTIVRLKNIETWFLIFWIMDLPVIWLVLKLDHVASLPLKTSGTLTKSSLLLIPSHLSHSGRNSAKWPFWSATPSGTLDRSRPGALQINRCSAPYFLSYWRCPLFCWVHFWISLPLICSCCINPRLPKGGGYHPQTDCFR